MYNVKVSLWNSMNKSKQNWGINNVNLGDLTTLLPTNKECPYTLNALHLFQIFTHCWHCIVTTFTLGKFTLLLCVLELIYVKVCTVNVCCCMFSVVDRRRVVDQWVTVLIIPLSYWQWTLLWELIPSVRHCSSPLCWSAPFVVVADNMLLLM